MSNSSRSLTSNVKKLIIYVTSEKILRIRRRPPERGRTLRKSIEKDTQRFLKPLIVSNETLIIRSHSLQTKKQTSLVETMLKEACSLAYPESAICVQRFDDSLNSAIRITYRISLRSSSLREPRYPLLRVVLCFVMNFISVLRV